MCRSFTIHMEKYKLNANNQFFLNLINVLIEGGIWYWPSNLDKDNKPLMYIKRGGKLIGNSYAISEVKKIVTDEFFNKYFQTLNS